jgi:hypothetical protein
MFQYPLTFSFSALAINEKITDTDEKRLLPSVIPAIVYERQQLKDLYT